MKFVEDQCHDSSRHDGLYGVFLKMWRLDNCGEHENIVGHRWSKLKPIDIFICSLGFKSKINLQEKSFNCTSKQAIVRKSFWFRQLAYHPKDASFAVDVDPKIDLKKLECKSSFFYVNLSHDKLCLNIMNWAIHSWSITNLTSVKKNNQK